MSKDYLVNLVFSFTFLNLAVVGISALSFDSTFHTMVRIGGVVCNLFMGVFLLMNKKAISDASPIHKPYWLGMIASNIAAVKLIDMNCSMFSIYSICFIVGLVIVLVSLFSMGNSFAVTPMLSRIRTSCIYSVVRHPMYLGESCMVISCILSSVTYLSLLLLIPYLFFTVMRIHEEEKLLLKSDTYKEYCASTPWRLLPFIW